MKNLITRFLKNESGATAIEYGLIAALVSLAIIAAVTTLGGSLSATFTGLATELGGSGTSSTTTTSTQ